MKSVWVVETGEYSDYRVVGVFSTEENAQLMADRVCGSVEEWPMDPWIDHINQGLVPYYVDMSTDGTINRITELRWSRSHPYETNLLFYHQQRSIIGTVFSTDEQHAIKIANEVRAQYIAEGKWPSDEDAE